MSARKPAGRHGRGAIDEPGRHDPGLRIGENHLGADARIRRSPGGDGLVRPVDVFLGAGARQPHTGVSDPKHQVGQSAQPFDGTGVVFERGDCQEAGAQLFLGFI
jgi:hypothetical protein